MNQKMTKGNPVKSNSWWSHDHVAEHQGGGFSTFLNSKALLIYGKKINLKEIRKRIAGLTKRPVLASIAHALDRISLY